MTTLAWLEVMAIGLCVVALISFAVGRKTGVRQGRMEGLRFAPLRLRQQSLETGACPICAHQVVDGVQSRTETWV